MPEVHYTTTIELAPEAIWEFVKDIGNWAPFLTGYQGHEEIDERHSVWTLRGDVGMLARMVKFEAHVTEWNGPERVAFTLKGINEAIDGDGALEVSLAKQADTEGGVPEAKRGWFRRVIDALFGWLFRALNKQAAPKRLHAAGGVGSVRSELRFRLRMDAGGPTAPLVNAMLGPAMQPAAEDLANKIAAHLERQHGLTDDSA
jgi:carbon monoxide dehydrogenase subunit G